MAALSACHMLSYLALCAREGIAIRTYDDSAEGTMTIAAGGGHFSEVTLRPQVTVAEGADLQQAMALHDTAHR